MPDQETRWIRIRGARTHNLQNISLDLPRDRFIVVTGLSGSGKSSLAFDTLYAEGQRKYVESLSAYARQFLGQMSKPDVDQITGLPPTIAISQQSGRSNPRSTVATTTEIYDFLRLLFARVGKPHCPKCGRRVQRQTVSQIVDGALQMAEGTRILVLAPLVRKQKGEHREVFKRILREGFIRVRVDGEILEVKDTPKLSAKKQHTIEAVVDRLVLKRDLRTRLSESVETSLRLSDGLVIISAQDPAAGRSGKWKDKAASARYACIQCGISLPDLEPRLFSFNSPHGACGDCDGLGTTMAFDPSLIVPDPKAPLERGAIAAWQRSGRSMTASYTRILREFCECFRVSPATPYERIPAELREILMFGTKPEDEGTHGHHFEGIIPNLNRRWETTDSDSVKNRLHAFLTESACQTCEGSRLRRESLSVMIHERTIADIGRLSIEAAFDFFSSFDADKEDAEIASPILDEIRRRLQFMNDVGIGYLTLDRSSSTLSGGESQRIRLATQVGSGLVGVCYVLDEPTIGLHQRDNDKLIETLRRLTEIGNTVVVVEHDVETINAAEWAVDIGPGAGAHGGRVLVNGPREDLLQSKESITAQYLNGDLQIESPEQRRPIVKKNVIQILGAAQNNLKLIDVSFPLGVFCCVTGVSGSGKSSLVNQILLPALQRRLNNSTRRPGQHERLVGAGRIDKIIEIDQSAIGRSPRSNPATYAGVFDRIRELYAKTREARIRGYTAGRFSFNVKGGRCEACQGHGTKRIEMHFLPDIFVRCSECNGTRYDRETLEIRYRGKSIADVLDMRAEEALRFFDSFHGIRALLQALVDVGLGYITLGQSANTLSGGEAQRIKLAAELGKPAAGHTLYVLDEPTTGLHFADIHKLLDVLNRLCNLGHTILVIEHNLDVIKQADWIIDLGPEGGDAGGRIICEGTPEEVAEHNESHTGRYLNGALQTKINT